MTSTLLHSKPIGTKAAAKAANDCLPDAASVPPLSEDELHRLDMEEYAIRMVGIA